MIVTFVGGPRHGSHRSMEHTPLTLSVADTDGTRMQYKRRLPSAGAMQQILVQVFYAPLRMPNKEFRRLSGKLHVPLEAA